MTITVNTKAYNLDSHQSANAAVYTGPASDFATKDAITLKRSAPKGNASFAGVAKSSIKLTRTIATGASTKADAIIEVSVSYPVGMSKSDADTLHADVAALLAASEGDDVTWKHDLNH